MATPGMCTHWLIRSLQWLLTNHRQEYPKRLWYCVASAIALFILTNIGSKLRRRARCNALFRGPPSFPKDIHIGPISWRRLPSAIGTTWYITAYRWTIPLGRNHVLCLIELGVTALYAAAVLTWSLVNCQSYPPRDMKCGIHTDDYCPYYPANGGQKDFWAQRAGDIAFTQIPLLPLLAGKNNLLTCESSRCPIGGSINDYFSLVVTGISYEKLNVMHRAVGRLSFILILLHTLSKAPYVDQHLPHI